MDKYVKVKLSGHQYYNEQTYKFIKYCDCVGHFDRKTFQVPGMLVEDGKAIKIIPLQQYLKVVDVVFIEDKANSVLIGGNGE